MAKTTNKQLGLLISHNIFLTPEEINKLIIGDDVLAIGVNVPVWVVTPSGKSTEPGVEIFCNYIISNNKDKSCFVKLVDSQCYKINLPQLPANYKPIEKPSMETWRAMSINNQEKWYADNKSPITASNLKGGYLNFEYQHKTKLEENPITIIHIVDIKSQDKLMNSLI